MAAVLCESLSKLLRGSCEALGTVLTLPCKACGFATEELTKVCRSPFCLYLSVALGLNLPPVVFTIKAWMSGANGGDGCASASNWLSINALLCLVNMMAALYISQKITYEPMEDPNAAPFMEASVMDHEKNAAAPQQKKTIVGAVMEKTLETNTRSKSVSRVKEILCYDPIVAIYIIIGMGYMVWQAMGVGRRLDASGCGGDWGEYVGDSLMCGFMFIFMGGTTFAISLCCLVR